MYYVEYHKNNQLIGDHYLNVTNHHSVRLLDDYKVERVTLSVELDDYKIRDIMKYQDNVEMIIYGRLELMVMKYCPLKKCLNYCNQCKNSQDKFYLEDKFSNLYPITRKNCHTTIMHHQVVDKLDNINNYQELGIHHYRLELFDENISEVKRLIFRIKNNI